MRKITKTINSKVYHIHLKPDPEGGFVVTVPALPGCVTWGEDQAQALEMAKEAIEGFLEALTKEGQPLPQDRSVYRLQDSLINVHFPTASL